MATALGTALALTLLGMALHRPDVDPFFVGEEEAADVGGRDPGRVAAGLERDRCACRLRKPLLEVVRAGGGREAEGWFLGLPDGLLVAAQARADATHDGGRTAPRWDVWLVGAMQPRFGLPGPGLTGGNEATPEQEEAWHQGGGLRYFVACDLGGDRIPLDTRNSDGTGDSRPRIGVRVLSVPCGRPVCIEVRAEGGLGVVGLRITLQCACGWSAREDAAEGRGRSDPGETLDGLEAGPSWTAKRLPPKTPGLEEWAATRARRWKDM
ncbi:MAG: hypothetical protein HY812_19330 [Planctomycetes bacterium]|nr:hypothetical protein [Planctomycetota bacterium]